MLLGAVKVIEEIELLDTSQFIEMKQPQFSK